MSKEKYSPNRALGNMAYIDNQIQKHEKIFKDKYQKIMSMTDATDKEGEPLREMIAGQFEINCSNSQLKDLILEARNELTYISQCIAELESLEKDLPKDTEYTDAEIASFIERACMVNKRMIQSQASNQARSNVNVRTGNDNLPRRVIEEGRKLQGIKYVWGGSDPNVHGGLDCSGFVAYAAKKAGYVIPGSSRHTTKTLINMGTEVKREELQIGDVLFPHSGHVGYYSGNGNFLHSPRKGDVIKEVPIYKFWRARRIIPGVGGDTTSDPAGGSSGGSSGGGSPGGDYYGPGSPVEWVERTPDPEVTKIIVPAGAASWSAISSHLGVGADSLKKLNPGVTTLHIGTTLYIPTSAVTQAKLLAAKSKNQSRQYNNYLDDTASAFLDTARMQNSQEGSSSPANESMTRAAIEQTPFQTFLNSEDYIKTYDLKEHEYKEKARIEINYSGKTRRIQTMISPISFNETHSNQINMQQTAGGWFVSRHGEAPVQLGVSGYLLDTKLAPEKHAFMQEFRNYMTDIRNKTTGNYENDAIIKIVMEGVEYEGHVTSVTYAKDANRPTLYTFNMNFTCLYYKNLRDIQEAVNILTPKSKSNSSVYMGEGIASIILK